MKNHIFHLKRYHIWHNTRGTANQYFFVRNSDYIVLFQIPNFIGRLLVD